ncbi:MAG: UDP-N-acetylmuramoyl-L-alanine--D-glutamate ligase [Anaerolineae bacterium]
MKDNIQFPVSALVVGLAREGIALSRFLAERGARVTVTDAKPTEALTEGMAALAQFPIRYALGGHPLELLDAADILFVSPGVPLEIPLLVEAQRRGLPMSSETRLFTRLCPAMIIGITGSSGKTTTTTLAGEMLNAAGIKTWVGGNIGRPLIGLLNQIQPDDLVVMELSSFQLEFFAPWPAGTLGQGVEGSPQDVLLDPRGWSPSIAAILNITPNHLDRHPSMEAYIAAKAHLINYQQTGDAAILGLDNPVTRWMGETIATQQRVLWFSLEQEVEEGAFLRGKTLVLRLADQEQVVCQTEEIRLLGRHNLANILAACLLAATAGAPIETLRRVARTFRGVEHRLELVRVRNQVRWYNDSIATSPERTVAALHAFDDPLILLAGGRDKHLPWEEMAALTWRKVRHLILFGEAAPVIEAAMRICRPSVPGPCQIHHAGKLDHAVELAAALAQPGDVVLFSPGGSSFDAYRDFVARGEHFRQLVAELG